MIYTRRLAFCAAAFIALIAAACGGGGNKKAESTPEVTQAPTDSGPEQAIAGYVQDTLQREFVADCSKADANNDKDKICASLQGERNNYRAYKIGPTFGDPTQWVIVENKAAKWAVLTTTAITSDIALLPGIPWPLQLGVDLIVTAQPDPCLNVHEGPGLQQKAVDCIANGTKIRLVAGPSPADGINWWQVEGRTGWVAGDYLRYPDAAQ
jgi:hypothetical protein